jgi:EmrB/QacA subfamily drug resistance transporter
MGHGVIDEGGPHGQRYALTFAILALGGGTFAALQSLVAPALPAIQRDLGVSAADVAWILSACLLSASVLTPIIGRLGDIFGKQRTLVAVLASLGLGTLVAALASSLPVILVGRVIQGTGGAIFPAAYGIIRDEFPRERVPQGIALMSAIIGIGGGLGVVLAGPIVDSLNYHWLFWIPFVLAVIATLATVLLIPESPVTSPGKINWGGAALLSAWLVCVLLGLSQGPTWGWGDPRTIGLIVAGIVLMFVWIGNERRAPESLVDMEMMRFRGVWTVNLAAFMVGAGMYSSFILIPQFVEMPRAAGYGFAASVTEAGLFLLPCTVAILLVSPPAGRLASAIGARVPLIAGCSVTCASFVMLAAAHTQRWEIYVASALLGAGIGLAFASLANLIVDAVRPEQTGVATGMNTVMRTLGGSVGSTIGATIITGSLTVSGLPTEYGFTLAFWVGAGACGLAVLASLLVPRPERPWAPGSAATERAPAAA